MWGNPFHFVGTVFLNVFEAFFPRLVSELVEELGPFSSNRTWIWKLWKVWSNRALKTECRSRALSHEYITHWCFHYQSFSALRWQGVSCSSRQWLFHQKKDIYLLFIVFPSMYLLMSAINSRVFSRVVPRQRVRDVNFPLFMQRTSEWWRIKPMTNLVEKTTIFVFLRKNRRYVNRIALW